jgi:hypothetical protein
MLPPLSVRLDTNPPLPFSVKMPTAVVVPPRRHVEVQVLERRGLGDLPVEARRHQSLVAVARLRRVVQVEVEVADLAKELALVHALLRP